MLDRNKRKENYNFTQQFFCTTKEITPAQVRTRSSFRRSRFSMRKSVQKGKGPVSNRPAFHHAHNSLFNCSPRNVFELAAALRWIIKKKEKEKRLFNFRDGIRTASPTNPVRRLPFYQLRRDSGWITLSYRRFVCTHSFYDVCKIKRNESWWNELRRTNKLYVFCWVFFFFFLCSTIESKCYVYVNFRRFIFYEFKALVFLLSRKGDTCAATCTGV